MNIQLTVDIWENGTKPRRPSTRATTPPLFAPTTCKTIHRNTSECPANAMCYSEMRAKGYGYRKSWYEELYHQTHTLPLITTSSACSCLHLSQARSYWIDRKLKTKLSSASFSPTTTNSSRKPGNIPASSTCLMV